MKPRQSITNNFLKASQSNKKKGVLKLVVCKPPPPPTNCGPYHRKLPPFLSWCRSLTLEITYKLFLAFLKWFILVKGFSRNHNSFQGKLILFGGRFIDEAIRFYIILKMHKHLYRRTPYILSSHLQHVLASLCLLQICKFYF